MVWFVASRLNVRADCQSRNVETNSEWKLLSSLFQTIAKMMDQPKIKHFASSLSHILTYYVACKSNLNIIGADAFQMTWTLWLKYAFHLILHDRSDFERSEKKRSKSSYNVSLILHFQPLYFQPVPLQVNPKFAPISNNERLSLRSFKKQTSSREKKAVKVKAWKVLRETLYYKEFQAKQPTLCQNLREQEQVQMRNRPR